MFEELVFIGASLYSSVAQFWYFLAISLVTNFLDDVWISFGWKIFIDACIFYFSFACTCEGGCVFAASFGNPYSSVERLTCHFVCEMGVNRESGYVYRAIFFDLSNIIF